MNPNPKQKRQTDKAYLKYIRQQPCLVSNHECLGDITYHHTMGKVFDYLTVPLCVLHHTQCHAIGKQTFQDNYEIDFSVEIIRLLKNYPKPSQQIVQLLKEIEGNKNVWEN